MEQAYELADALEEEAQLAENMALAHNSAMAATQLGGSGTSALVCGSETEPEQQQLDRTPEPLLQPEHRTSNPVEPTNKMRFGVARNTFDSPRLGTQLRVKTKQRQAEHEITAQNEAILRAQKSARRRIVQEARRTAAVKQLVRIADGGQCFWQSQSASESSAFGDSIVSTSTSPAWIDDANGRPAITFVSPRQVKLQTESEYRKQQPAVAASTSKGASVNRPAFKGTQQQPVRIGIQDKCSTRSFPTMLPLDLPAPLYLTMQQREADRATKEEERRAREQGWRSSMQVNPTPPEERIYKYGDMEIQVGGRGSRIVDATVSEIRSQRKKQAKAREDTIGYATQTAGVWKDSGGSKLATGLANAPSVEQRGMATDSELDR